MWLLQGLVFPAQGRQEAGDLGAARPQSPTHPHHAHRLSLSPALKESGKVRTPVSRLQPQHLTRKLVGSCGGETPLGRSASPCQPGRAKGGAQHHVKQRYKSRSGRREARPMACRGLGFELRNVRKSYPMTSHTGDRGPDSG